MRYWTTKIERKKLNDIIECALFSHYSIRMGYWTTKANLLSKICGLDAPLPCFTIIVYRRMGYNQFLPLIGILRMG